MPGQPAIKAYPPWSEGNGPTEVTPRELAPRETVTYHCAGPPNGKGTCPHGTFPVPFAANVTPPPAVWCRCGGVARQDGASPDSRPQTPGYDGNKNPKTDEERGVTPQAQLRERCAQRPTGWAQQALAERMAQVRDGGWSR